jgi:hypothetical protein
MAIIHVAGQSGKGTTTTTLALTPTTGNVLIATISLNSWGNSPTVTSIAETGVIWYYATSILINAAWDVEIWIGIVGATPSKTVTLSLSHSSAETITDIYEYSGMLTTDYLDKTASNPGGFSAQTDTGTTVGTSQPNELWIGAIYAQNNQSNPTNGFTLYDGVKGTWSGLGYLEKIVSAMGTANSGTTITAQSWFGCIATFKGASEYSPKTRSTLPSTMATMLNSKMLFG